MTAVGLRSKVQGPKHRDAVAAARPRVRVAGVLAKASSFDLEPSTLDASLEGES